MALEPGTELTTYEIISLVGRGGMGEVYRARDKRLSRDVAIKVLPDPLARDEERVRRFEREAKLLASLNHSGIAHIYGFEESAGKKFLVLEYVEGETLAARLKRGALPVDEALEICKGIAEALEAAHDQGVIHRDLKPGNVMITTNGAVKVLDFGLARAMQDTPSNVESPADSPTITAEFTQPGVVLGTAPYMSPEQARGQPLDKRTDIWSFGVILYEVLTGESLFRGETKTDSIAAILHKRIDLERLPRGTLPGLKPLLARCLARERQDRYRDIGDVLLDLKSLGDQELSSPGEAKRRSIASLVVVGLFMASLGAATVWYFQRPAPDDPAPSVKFTVDVPGSGEPADWALLSPDGAALAIEVDDEIWIRRLDQTTPRKLGLPWGAGLLAWSPDSRWVIVEGGTGPVGEFWMVGVDSGEKRVIGRKPDSWIWGVATRGEDELIVGTPLGGIHTIPIRGGHATAARVSR